MKNRQTNLEQMKGKNPFLTPEGYMDGLTSRIMSRLPDKPVIEAGKVSLADRVRPWLYLAAVFAGLALFFDMLVGFNKPSGEGTGLDSLLVRSEIAVNGYAFGFDDAISDDDAEYLEYIESQYASYILEEEMAQDE